MTNAAILAASVLLLFAYLVDIFGRRFRLPSVVMLIVTGIALRQLADATGLHLGWVDPVVPVIGTIGLILIVLEGALDLNVVRERMALIAISSTSALAGFLATFAAFAVLFNLALGFEPSVAALGLFFLINRLAGHVRFLPLIAGLIFLYAIGKAVHLSPLVLILVCGLLLNNPHLLEWSPRLHALHGPDYDQTLKEFKGVIAELTFATKSFFFLLLGYWTELRELASAPAWMLAVAIIVGIFSIRYVLLALLRQPARAQLVWLAPRGLITVLLFLSAVHSGALGDFPLGAVMLVVLISSAATGLAHRGIPGTSLQGPDSVARAR